MFLCSMNSFYTWREPDEVNEERLTDKNDATKVDSHEQHMLLEFALLGKDNSTLPHIHRTLRMNSVYASRRNFV